MQDSMSQSPAASFVSLSDRLKKLRHVALDMDGTIYRGGTLFPFTNPFLDLLQRLGISYSFLTNNSSKSVAEYVARLRKMGVLAEPQQIYISTQATLEYLQAEHPEVRRLFLLGANGMAGEIRAAGYQLTEDNATDEPDAVLVGFDLDLQFSRLCRAAYWIKQGKLFVASHPDRVCPTDEPTVIVDCGAVCAALESATGRAPDAIPGKPDPRMLLGLARRLRLEPSELAMVGDRIYTDIEMARRAGALGVLVLSGEATAADVATLKCPPDFVAPDLEAFGERLKVAREERA
jgi:HAD superfamily hydrolase (TIGR01450 family)